MNIFFLGGDKELKYRTLPSDRTSNEKLTSKGILGGIEVGLFHYLYLYQNNVFNDEITLKTYEHNFSGSIELFETDIYLENSQINYIDVTNNNEKKYGMKLYSSIYRDILGFGLTYEYKNYVGPSILDLDDNI